MRVRDGFAATLAGLQCAQTGFIAPSQVEAIPAAILQPEGQIRPSGHCQTSLDATDCPPNASKRVQASAMRANRLMTLLMTDSEHECVPSGRIVYSLQKLVNRALNLSLVGLANPLLHDLAILIDQE